MLIVLDLPMLREVAVNEGSVLNCHEIVFEGRHWANAIQHNGVIC